MNKYPTLSKKVLTKLLDNDFRKNILNKYASTQTTRIDRTIDDYANYVVTSTIASRAKEHEKDKAYNYGFSPIGIICAVMNDGSVDQRLLDFGTINNFLRQYKGEFAAEVVKCICIMWKAENSNIKNFDYNIIDEALIKMEKEYIEKQKAEQAKQEMETSEQKLEGVKSPNIGDPGIAVR